MEVLTSLKDNLLLVLALTIYLVESTKQFILIWNNNQALKRAQIPPAVTPTKPAPIPVAPPAAAPVTPPKPAPVPVPAEPHPLVSDALVQFTSKQEGFSSKAYWDYKQYTIGYGTKASGPNETITEAQAKQALLNELNHAAKSVEAFIPNAPMGVKQAMIDATFNLGTGWMQQGLGTALKAGDYTKAKESLLQYNHAGGQVLSALTKRREAEVSWFDSPI